jgi:hypothetical protein
MPVRDTEPNVCIPGELAHLTRNAYQIPLHRLECTVMCIEHESHSPIVAHIALHHYFLLVGFACADCRNSATAREIE